MKLTLALILLLNIQAIANVYSQTKVTLNLKSVDFKKVLSTIEKQSSYHFVYSERKIPVDKKVNIDVKNQEVLSVLNDILTNSGFTYNELANNLIVILPVGEQINVAKITGKVVDENGQPMPGASIKLKGAKTGTTTDANGLFNLDAPDNAVLVISFIGYQDKEVTVSGTTPLNITLTPSNRNLTEVVVVGYGTQKKVNLTGAVASITSEQLDSRPMVNLGDGLQGLIPNLNVNLNTGQPGRSASFNVRGINTLNPNSNPNSVPNTSPLILVDGVARDPGLIDPNDVESVVVLKDAASAAIYGGRAANGVILITTKTGKKGATRLSYSGSYTTSRPTKLVHNVNSGDYINMFNTANRTGLLSGGYTTTSYTALDSIKAAAFRNDPANNPSAYQDPNNLNDIRYRYVGNTDWTDVLYPGWAPQTQHNLSLTGGSDNSSYTASMGYFRQDGLEKVAKQVYQRYTPSLKLNTDVTKWLSLGANLSLTHIDNNQPATSRINQGGPTNGGWLEQNLPPILPVTNPDGNYAGQGYYTNPVALMNLSGRDIDSRNDFWSTARAVIKPVKHLTINGDYTWNSFSQYDKAALKPYNEYGVNGVFVGVFPWTNPSSVIEKRQNNTYTALNAYATYENTIAKKHYLKALVGYNQEYFHYNIGQYSAINLIDPNLPAIGQNNDPKPKVSDPTNTVESEAALVGSFFRVNYIYDNRYLLEVNGRYDGTSRFRPDSRYSFSPSISAGWNVAEESFMRDFKNAISQLKIRASYGKLPDQGTPTSNGVNVISSAAQYPYIATQLGGPVNYLINGQPANAVFAPGLVSSNFTWSKVETKNIGIDFAVLKDKLSGSFDYFITNTNDILVKSTQLPSVLGTTAPPTNSANLHKTGWELSLNWRDRAFENKLSYNIILSLANNTATKVTKYNANPTNSLNDFYVGQYIGDRYGFTNLGYYKTDAEAAAVNNSALAGYKWLAGDIKYADLNGDGKIDYGSNTVQSPGDRKIIANTSPHYNFGLSLNLGYKNFDFTTFIQGVMQQKFLPNDYIFYAFRDDEYSTPSQSTTDFWTPTNTNAYFPRVRFAGGGNEQDQDKYVLNAAYARIKQITLGYSLPKAITSKIKLNRIRFYVTGANLFTITSLNKNYDPELLGQNIYPLNKSVSFGIQATL